MFLDINEIDENGLSFDDELVLEPMEDGAGQATVVVGARIHGRVERTSGHIELIGRLDATVRCSCARCLEPFDVPVRAGFELRLVAEDPDSAIGDEDDDDGDVSRFHAPEGRADLRAIAIEQIYLSLPMKAVCREDCKGLCPTCGVDRNSGECGCPDEIDDPRLAPLRELKRRMSDG